MFSRYLPISRQVFFTIMFAVMLSLLGVSYLTSFVFNYYLPADVYGMMAELREKLNWMLLILIALSAVLAFFVARSISRPVKKLEEHIKNTSAISLEPIRWEGFPDIRPLIDSYNEMLAKLREQNEALLSSEREAAFREFAQIAMHEIKNPLTPMRLTLQLFAKNFDPAAPDAKQKADELSAALIEQIDILSSLAASFALLSEAKQAEAESSNVFDVMASSCVFFQNAELEVPEELRKHALPIKARKLSTSITNLLLNAQQAGASKIVAGARRRQGNFIIYIRDNGQGMEKEAVERIFEPHFTSKTSGSGLGLAIVKSNIEGAGGKVFCKSAKGEGAVFELVFPL